jgi:dimethylamine monooxygenase subunit A
VSAAPPLSSPFPVVAPYRVRADMARLGDARAVPDALDPGPPSVFRAVRDWPDLLRERLDALEAAPERVRALDPGIDPARLSLAADAIARRAAAEVPGQVRRDGAALALPRLGLRVEPGGRLRRVRGPDDDAVDERLRERVLALLDGRPAALRAAEALALALDEDLVLLAAGASGEGRVAWLHVCFPSGWDPGAMAAASFAQLHAPVPGAAALLRAGPALVRAMLSKGPYVRYVWGLSPDGARSRHPDRARPMHADHPLAEAWLRVERQTTLALPDSSLALFAIGVHVTQLPYALSSAERRDAFAAAVASLGPAERRYKGVPWSGEAVRAWCDALA